MAKPRSLRTFDDLLRAVRAVAYEFGTDTVYVVGSQAVLASMPDAPESVRGSPEIDAFPANARAWEARQDAAATDGVKALASEHIDGLFGAGSQFHRTHGFYIDGVDDTTARLPDGWGERAVEVTTEVDGRVVTGVAPALEDLVVSKLARLDPKDRRLVEAVHAHRPLDLREVERRIGLAGLDPASARRAVDFVRGLMPGPEDAPSGPKAR